MGGGRMGSALAAGLVASDWGSGSEISVVEKNPARRIELSVSQPELAVCPEPPTDLDDGTGWVLAVKPADAQEAGRQVQSMWGVRPGPVLSIVAGLRLARLESWLGDASRVIRAMPNTPALVGAGASALSRGGSATDQDVAWSEAILSAVGSVHWVPESLLDAVTGLSGSGPAYVFLMAEALTEAGVLVGLSRDLSLALTTQTLLGAAQMLAQGSEGPEALRAAVTSPGGTTAAGIKALEDKGMRSAFMDAVVAATAKSIELGA